MRKKWWLIIVLCCALTSPASAHLTGAFADFLAIVYDDTTITQLQQELANTRAEIEALTPQIDAANAAFRTDQQQAVQQLQFYTDVGLDTWLAMIHSGSDVVDLLGSQWVMEQQIDRYLDEVNVLYRQYEQLQSNQQMLQGHADLLHAIEKNLAARQAFLAENSGLALDVIANYLDIDWTAEVEAHIIAQLQADAALVTAQLRDWEQNYAFEEAWLNERSEARYYFRSDHIYIEYELEYAHVLLLGQIVAHHDAATLQLEAGFYNGFFLPEELLVELPSFSLDYEQLRTLPNMQQPFVTQHNGRLFVQSK